MRSMHPVRPPTDMSAAKVLLTLMPNAFLAISSSTIASKSKTRLFLAACNWWASRVSVVSAALFSDIEAEYGFALGIEICNPD